LRTEAQELQRKLGDTVAWLWGSGGPFGGVVQAVDGFDFIGGTYTYTHSAPFTPITADMVTDEMIEECYPEYFSKKDKAFKEMARLAIVPAYNAVGKYMGAKK
jgi:hypothetical protein